VQEQPRGDLSGLIFIKAGNKIHNIRAGDILFAEAKGNYTKIVTVNMTILPSMSFTSFEKTLPNDLFIRVHRSYIINKSRITEVIGNMAYIGSTGIPIGSFYKESFHRSIGL
jgi:DNA-binding LytR/AlgR family response regulator